MTFIQTIQGTRPGNFTSHIAAVDMSKKDKKQLKKIKTSGFSRGMSLLNLAVSSTVKFAGKKVTDPFYSAENKENRLKEFLLDRASVLVKELEILKGSVMKAGQMLSVYGEHFFPPEVNSILKALQSDSRHVSWEEMQKVLHRQLGKDVVAKLHIQEIPIAAASMGQVYEGVYKGKPVAIKVQYPGVDQAIDSDLKALKRILSLSKLIPNGEGTEELFKEVRMMLHYEADYSREVATLNKYIERLKTEDFFVIPKVYEEISTKRVIVMDKMEGVRIDSPTVLGLSQERRNKLCDKFLGLYFQEAFNWREVQTDPHFGNYLIQVDSVGSEDRIVLLDFGAVRSFPKRYIQPFSDMALASIEDDEKGVEEAARKLGFLKPEDSEGVIKLFTKICLLGASPFKKQYDPQYGGEGFNFSENDLVEELTKLGKDAAFAFKLRPPPREAVFMDRKLVGTYTILKTLGYVEGPYSAAKEFLPLRN